MDWSDRLFNEANLCTAAIMEYLETVIVDRNVLDSISKHIGDILHNSRRRLTGTADGRKYETVDRG